MKSKKLLRIGLVTISFLLILVPRVTDLGTVATTDEPAWIYRNNLFLEYVSTGEFAKTFVTPHPGVTLMWIGSGSQLLDDAVRKMGLAGKAETETLREPHSRKKHQLKVVQRGVAIVVSVFLFLACLWLARAMQSDTVLILAALLVGLDPFAVGLSRIFHLDALLAAFVLGSCIAMVRFLVPGGLSSAQEMPRRLSWLVASGLLTGLGFLTKTTGAILLPWVLAFLLASGWVLSSGRHERGWPRLFWVISWGAKRWFVWCMVIAATVVALWPAMWMDPIGVLVSLTKGVLWAYETPHFAATDSAPVLDLLKNYFLRYPIFIAFWIPWMLVLCALSGLVLFIQRRSRHTVVFSEVANPISTTHFGQREWLLIFVALISLTLLFPLGLGYFQKQAARYLLTSFIAIDLIVAILCWRITVEFKYTWPDLRGAISSLSGALVLFLGIFCWTTVYQWLPYATTYRNPWWSELPINGKPLLRGWSEGLELVADRLHQLENSKHLTVAVQNMGVLRIFFRGTSVGYTSVLEGTADLIVLHRTFVEQYTRHPFIENIRDQNQLLDTVYLPQDSDNPVAWIYWAKEYPAAE